jgi:hypothetical protein
MVSEKTKMTFLYSQCANKSRLFICTTVGNKRFRDLIGRYAPHYVTATTKLEKTQVIAAVIDKVRTDSPGGGFVKKDFYSGRWHEIGNEKARDKVGHAIRKAAEDIQKQEGKAGKSLSKKAKKAAKVGSPRQEAKESSSPSVLAASQLPGAASLFPSPLSTYAGDLLSPSFATTRPYLGQNMAIDGQIMPGLSRPPMYFEAQQPYMSSLRALSLPESALQQALSGGAPFGVDPLFGNARGASSNSLGLGQSTVQAGVGAPSDASTAGINLINRMAAMRELELQQSMSAYRSRASQGPLLNTLSSRQLDALNQALLSRNHQAGNAPVPSGATSADFESFE